MARHGENPKLVTRPDGMKYYSIRFSYWVDPVTGIPVSHETLHRRTKVAQERGGANKSDAVRRLNTRRNESWNGTYTSPSVRRKQETQVKAERIKKLGHKIKDLLYGFVDDAGVGQVGYIKDKLAKVRSDAVQSVWSKSGVLYDQLGGLRVNAVESDRISKLISYMETDAPRLRRGPVEIDPTTSKPVQQTGLKPNTVRGRIDSISDFYRWAIERRYAIKNPTVDVRKPAKEESDPAPISPVEYGMILTEARKPEWPRWAAYVIQVQLGLGMDISDVCYLHRDDLGQGRTRVTLKRRKSRKPQVAELTDTIRAIFKAQPPHADGHIFHDDNGANFASRQQCKNSANVLRAIVRAAGVNAHGRKLFRHSMGTWRALAGEGMYAIKSAMGHSSLTMTDRYVKDLHEVGFEIADMPTLWRIVEGDSAAIASTVPEANATWNATSG